MIKSEMQKRFNELEKSRRELPGSIALSNVDESNAWDHEDTMMCTWQF